MFNAAQAELAGAGASDTPKSSWRTPAIGIWSRLNAITRHGVPVLIPPIRMQSGQLSGGEVHSVGRSGPWLMAVGWIERRLSAPFDLC